LGLPRPIIKSHTEEKVDVILYYRSSPKFCFNICAMAEASSFKFGMQLELAKAHHKNHIQRKKWAWLWAREAAKYVGFPFNISAMAALSS